MYTCTSPDGQTCNQIDHILLDRRWLSSVLDVRSFRLAVFETDLYLVIPNDRERLTVNQQATQKFDRKDLILES